MRRGKHSIYLLLHLDQKLKFAQCFLIDRSLLRYSGIIGLSDSVNSSIHNKISLQGFIKAEFYCNIVPFPSAWHSSKAVILSEDEPSLTALWDNWKLFLTVLILKQALHLHSVLHPPIFTEIHIPRWFLFQEIRSGGRNSFWSPREELASQKQSHRGAAEFLR